MPVFVKVIPIDDPQIRKRILDVVREEMESLEGSFEVSILEAGEPALGIWASSRRKARKSAEPLVNWTATWSRRFSGSD